VHSGAEAIMLKRGDLEFGLETNDCNRLPYFTVRLRDRKGWQEKLGERRDVKQRGQFRFTL
jgi:hypothetical protein